MRIHIAESALELGKIAAQEIATSLRNALLRQDHVRVIFAAAPSQSAMLAFLRREPDIDWRRVTAFHMDEYVDLPKGAPQRFGSWLKREFFDHVPLARTHLIEEIEDPDAACLSYARLLAEAPIDLVLLGIGTNGHLAFNDPPADLNDPAPVKVVELDEMCREQQVFDGCFPTLADVPRRAISLTIPTLLAGRELFCCVPGRHKRAAVRAMLESPVSGDCPATALRTHPDCTLYLDQVSSSVSEANGISSESGSASPTRS